MYLLQSLLLSYRPVAHSSRTHPTTKVLNPDCQMGFEFIVININANMVFVETGTGDPAQDLGFQDFGRQIPSPISLRHLFSWQFIFA